MSGIGAAYSYPGAEQVALGSTVQTASGQTAALPGYLLAKTLRAQLAITAVSGTSPTLNVVIEDTLDGTNWNQVAAFTQATAVGAQVINVTTPFCDRLRIRWTIAGTTPSFTFEVRWAAEPN